MFFCLWNVGTVLSCIQYETLTWSLWTISIWMQHSCRHLGENNHKSAVDFLKLSFAWNEPWTIGWSFLKREGGQGIYMMSLMMTEWHRKYTFTWYRSVCILLINLHINTRPFPFVFFFQCLFLFFNQVNFYYFLDRILGSGQVFVYVNISLYRLCFCFLYSSS